MQFTVNRLILYMLAYVHMEAVQLSVQSKLSSDCNMLPPVGTLITGNAKSSSTFPLVWVSISGFQNELSRVL